MEQIVEFFFDVGSPASYIAYKRLPQLREDTKARIVHRPMLLGGVFKATGNIMPTSMPAKNKWFWEDLERTAEYNKIPFRQNPFFPINTLTLMRSAYVAEDRNELEPYLNAVSEDLWVNECNLMQPENIKSCLESNDLDSGAYFEGVNDPEIKDRLKATTLEAIDRGVFGAPTFFHQDTMFFGQDRMFVLQRQLIEKETEIAREQK